MIEYDSTQLEHVGAFVKVFYQSRIQIQPIWVYGAHKYRFGRQKGVNNSKYLMIFGRYNVSDFQRTFDRLYISKNREATSE